MVINSSQTGVIDMSVTDGGEASIAPYVAGGSTLILKTNASGSGVSELDFALHPLVVLVQLSSTGARFIVQQSGSDTNPLTNKRIR